MSNSRVSVTTQKIKIEIVREEYVNKTACSIDENRLKSVNKADVSIIDVKK